MPSYTYITKQHQFDLVVSQLSGMSRVAVDTESSGYYTYFPELCLIQISSGEYHFIIDPLAGLKLDSLGAIFADPGITKIFHSASSDIGELRRDYNWDFRNVFDTFIACRMLGHESCSLASLVQSYLGHTMKKGEQKSNWKKRPLTRSQLDYAHLDTAYLEILMEKMGEDLKRASMTEEYRQEVEWVVQDRTASEKQFDSDGWIRIPGAAQLEPGQRGCLKGLYELRDMAARRWNIAPFRLSSNRSLLDICQDVPGSMEELERMQAIHPRYIREEGPRFLRIVESAPEIHDHELPVLDQPDQEIMEVLKRLKRWRFHVSRSRNMDPSVILNNRVLTQLATDLPETMEQLRSLNLMTEWKLDHYGGQILKVIAGTMNVENPEQELYSIQTGR